MDASILFFLVPLIIVPLALGLVNVLWQSTVDPARAVLAFKSPVTDDLSRDDARAGIKKLARTATQACTAVFWFSLVSYAVLALVVVAVTLAPGLGFAIIRDALAEEGFSAVTVVESLMAIGLFKLLAAFFKKIGGEDGPFTSETARGLGAIGKYLFAMWVVTLVVGNLIAVAAAIPSGLEGLDDLSLSSTGDVPILLIALFVILLARIFEYGCILQREDDGLV